MGDLVNGPWRTAAERAFMRTPDGEISRLTRVVEALREAHACARASRPPAGAEVITLSALRVTTNA